MAATVLSVTDAVRHFSDYLNRVAYRREAFVLQRGRQKLAELRPLQQGLCLGDLPGLLSRLPKLASGDSAAFEADVRACRKEANICQEGLRDPWVS